MANIGILGGTFDPPHLAHITMARVAISRIPLDNVLFMPSPQPPHKDSRELSPYSVRKKMIELALDGENRMELSLYEEFRKGPSYTVDLLEHLRAQSNDELYLILGADSVSDLPNWKAPQQILRLATLVIFPRSGYSSRVPVLGDASVVLFEDPVIDISSTQIRETYRRGGSASEQLPQAVHKFILDNSLYT